VSAASSHQAGKLASGQSPGDDLDGHGWSYRSSRPTSTTSPGVQPGPGSTARLRPGLGGTLGPANEIDDARWVPLGEAPGLLSYEHDRRLLEGGQPAQ